MREEECGHARVPPPSPAATCSNGPVSGLAGLDRKAAFPCEIAQWHAGLRNPLTVAGAAPELQGGMGPPQCSPVSRFTAGTRQVPAAPVLRSGV
jgi:hypothetical protein